MGPFAAAAAPPTRTFRTHAHSKLPASRPPLRRCARELLRPAGGKRSNALGWRPQMWEASKCVASQPASSPAPDGLQRAGRPHRLSDGCCLHSAAARGLGWRAGGMAPDACV